MAGMPIFPAHHLIKGKVRPQTFFLRNRALSSSVSGPVQIEAGTVGTAAESKTVRPPINPQHDQPYRPSHPALDDAGFDWQLRPMARHIIQNADETPDGRRTAAAALRNTGPLVDTLKSRLPQEGRVLEVASGTGQHAAAFAAAFPGLSWTPSDVDPGQRGSIAAWRKESGLPNLSDPLAIDIAAPWPVARGAFGTVLTINLLHLVPQPFVSRLFSEAHRVLCDAGRLVIYGPFLRGTAYASEGDQAFDASLRARDPAIGYKSAEEVADMAGAAGFSQVAADAMPANNLLLTFARS